MRRNAEQIGQRPALELGRIRIDYLAIRKGGRGTMKWSAAAPKGGERGGKKSCSNTRHQHHNWRCEQFVYSSHALPPHPLTTTDSALSFEGTFLRNTWQCSWDVHCGCSHTGKGLSFLCGAGYRKSALSSTQFGGDTFILIPTADQNRSCQKLHASRL